MEGKRRPIETIEGTGGSLAEALEDAARKAVDANAANVGKEYVVLYHVVTVDNPRISEHKITLAAGEG